MTEQLHTADAHDVIAAELVACTLGQRRRPELRTDAFGAFTRAFMSIGRALRDVFQAVQS